MGPRPNILLHKDETGSNATAGVEAKQTRDTHEQPSKLI